MEADQTYNPVCLGAANPVETNHRSNTQPYVLRFVGTLLAAPRKEYSRDISEFLAAAPNTFPRDNYVSGLIFVVCIMGGFLFLWSFVLVWMSFHGDYVGCAAGRPFEAAMTRKRRRKSKEIKRVIDNSKAQPPINPRDVEETNEEDGGCKGCADMDDWSDVQSSPDKRTESKKSDPMLTESLSQRQAETIDDAPTASDGDQGRSKQSFDQDGRVAKCDSLDEAHMQNPVPSMRERRTQFCFFVFAFASLLCVPFILALSVKPLLVVTKVVTSILDEKIDDFDEAMAALKQLDKQSSGLSILLESVANTTFSSICPFTDNVENTYNLNLENAYSLIADQDPSIVDQWETDLKELSAVLESQSSVASEIRRYNDLAAAHAWVPPVLLFSMGVMTILLTVGVYLAWDRESSLRFQNLLSYTVLPVLILCSLSCWVAVFGSAVTTSISFDFCFSGGSPSQTIASLLQKMGYQFGSPMYDFTLNYVLECPWSDPTESLDDEASRIEIIAELVRFTVSQADAVGRTEIADACGAIDGETEAFLSDSSVIVSEITAVQASITETNTFFACENVGDAYDALINDSFCDVGASAFAWSFVFFLVAGVSTMSMISMRASWRHKDIEDKIFDESEVAENMVVDEHEEVSVSFSLNPRFLVESGSSATNRFQLYST